MIVNPIKRVKLLSLQRVAHMKVEAQLTALQEQDRQFSALKVDLAQLEGGVDQNEFDISVCFIIRNDSRSMLILLMYPRPLRPASINRSSNGPKDSQVFKQTTRSPNWVI